MRTAANNNYTVSTTELFPSTDFIVVLSARDVEIPERRHCGGARTCKVVRRRTGLGVEWPQHFYSIDDNQHVSGMLQPLHEQCSLCGLGYDRTVSDLRRNCPVHSPG